MSKLLKFKIRAPGTSANLGPGFDIMGLALNIYNDFFFETRQDQVFLTEMFNGAPVPFDEKHNLVIKAYENYYSLFLPDKVIPGFNLKLKLDLPLKGGLGSSASALVAGMEAARYIHKIQFPEIPLPSEREILYQLALMEGHPDNTTPAMTGGLAVSFFNDETGLEYYKHKFPGCVSIFAFIPDIQMCTNTSRSELPEKYSAKDVVFNMSRITAWYEFLQSGKSGHLKYALQDRIHTPYRIKKGSVLSTVTDVIEKHVIGYSLSGSGPTMLFYCQRNKAIQVEKKLTLVLNEAMKKENMSYRFFKVKVDSDGVLLQSKSS